MNLASFKYREQINAVAKDGEHGCEERGKCHLGCSWLLPKTGRPITGREKMMLAKLHFHVAQR